MPVKSADQLGGQEMPSLKGQTKKPNSHLQKAHLQEVPLRIW